MSASACSVFRPSSTRRLPASSYSLRVAFSASARSRSNDEGVVLLGVVLLMGVLILLVCTCRRHVGRDGATARHRTGRVVQQWWRVLRRVRAVVASASA